MKFFAEVVAPLTEASAMGVPPSSRVTNIFMSDTCFVPKAARMPVSVQPFSRAAFSLPMCMAAPCVMRLSVSLTGLLLNITPLLRWYWKVV